MPHKITLPLQLPPPDEFHEVLSTYPFVVVDGVINIRAISGAQLDYTVKPFHVFRSGDLTQITDTGKEQLRTLVIKKVFDLRSDHELATLDTPLPQIPGVELVRVPIYPEDAFDDVKRELLLKRYKENALQTFLDEYSKILVLAGLSFKVIFTHLRDYPDEPVLVHCTAGKDRTGLFAAILLMLLGVSDEHIARDYSLTAIGLAPFNAALSAHYMKQPVIAANLEGFLEMGSAREETMLASLNMIRETFGGADGYLRQHSGMGPEDLEKIRQNLRVPRN